MKHQIYDVNEEFNNILKAFKCFLNNELPPDDIFSKNTTTSTTPSYGPEDNNEELNNLNTEAQNCIKCAIGKQRTNLVFGAGNSNSDLMLIGEGPGREEDEQGYPFVGKAGQLLTKMFDAINFKRNDIYITNIIKCRPPNNRNPEPSEIKNCLHFLLKQISIIKPIMLCTLGKFASQTILNTDKTISSIRGKIFTFNNIPVMPIFHPSYLLRSPYKKKDTWEDLKNLRIKFDELKS